MRFIASIILNFVSIDSNWKMKRLMYVFFFLKKKLRKLMKIHKQNKIQFVSKANNYFQFECHLNISSNPTYNSKINKIQEMFTTLHAICQMNCVGCCCFATHCTCNIFYCVKMKWSSALKIATNYVVLCGTLQFIHQFHF